MKLFKPFSQYWRYCCVLIDQKSRLFSECRHDIIQRPSTKLLSIGRQITGRFCYNYDVVHFSFSKIHPIGNQQLPATHIWLVMLKINYVITNSVKTVWVCLTLIILFFWWGGGKLSHAKQNFVKKSPCWHNNITAVIKQVSLLDNALCHDKYLKFQFKKTSRHRHGSICPTPNIFKVYFTLIWYISSLARYRVFHILPHIYIANHATFTI